MGSMGLIEAHNYGHRYGIALTGYAYFVRVVTNSIVTAPFLTV